MSWGAVSEFFPRYWILRVSQVPPCCHMLHAMSERTLGSWQVTIWDWKFALVHEVDVAGI